MRAIALLLVMTVGGCGAADQPSVHEGDIIFHTSRSSQSVAIQRATHSEYSHMGMIVYKDGKPYVLEAVATVRFTPLGDWIKRGVGSHYVVKRLKEAEATLSPDGTNRLKKAALRFSGRPYDLVFEWSDAKMYCSELVWKAYNRGLGIKIGELQRLGDFDLTDKAVQAKLRERYGNHVPLDEPVISPAAMFESPLLVTVHAQ